MSTSYTSFDTFDAIANAPRASSRNGKSLTVFFTASMYAGFRGWCEMPAAISL